MDGIVKAKERGVKFGRKNKLTRQQITELQQGGWQRNARKRDAKITHAISS
jgi:hypothetical protein